MATKRSKSNYMRDLAAVSMCTALIIVSAWLTIPFVINFTLQTLAIFVICLLFNFKVSFFSILVYILIGTLGIPVFSSFGAGFSAIIGPTGGYILSFLLFPFIIDIFFRKAKNIHTLRLISMLICILICYTIGTVWFWLAYGNTCDGFYNIISICVFPFVIPDLIKILIADIIYVRLSKNHLMN